MNSHRNKLNIIGNGFDLANGVRSSYSDFRRYLLKDKGTGKTIYSAIETLLSPNEDWSDFEYSLANMDRGVMMDVFDDVFHTFIPTEDTDDNEFSYGEYYAAIEAGMVLPHAIMYDMPIYFHKWLRQLRPSGPKWRCPIWLYKDATYLNFNYTELLETRYGIPRDRILYIHGDRRGKKENIILGHGDDCYDNFKRWWESVKDKPEYQKTVLNRKGKKIPNRRASYLVYGTDDDENKPWRSAIQYYALDKASQEIEEYFEPEFDTTSKVKCNSWTCWAMKKYRCSCMLFHVLQT